MLPEAPAIFKLEAAEKLEILCVLSGKTQVTEE